MESLIATATVLWLATLFAYSGSFKLIDYEASVGAVSGYKLLPDSTARAIGVALPWVELAACGLLLVPVTRTAGAALAVALGVVFAGASATALARKLDVSCGCTGRNSRVNRITLIRSLTIVAGAMAVIAVSPNVNAVVAMATVALALLPALLGLRRRLAYGKARGHDGHDRQLAHHNHHRASEAEIATLTALIARPPSGAATVSLPVVVQERA